MAQRGQMNGRQVVSEAWIAEVTSWGPQDQSGLWASGKHRNSTRLLEEGSLGVGYKGFFWHHRADGVPPSCSAPGIMPARRPPLIQFSSPQAPSPSSRGTTGR